jgi:hypothetical protein
MRWVFNQIQIASYVFAICNKLNSFVVTYPVRMCSNVCYIFVLPQCKPLNYLRRTCCFNENINFATSFSLLTKFCIVGLDILSFLSASVCHDAPSTSSSALPHLTQLICCIDVDGRSVTAGTCVEVSHFVSWQFSTTLCHFFAVGYDLFGRFQGGSVCPIRTGIWVREKRQVPRERVIRNIFSNTDFMLEMNVTFLSRYF